METANEYKRSFLEKERILKDQIAAQTLRENNYLGRVTIEGTIQWKLFSEEIRSLKEECSKQDELIDDLKNHVRKLELELKKSSKAKTLDYSQVLRQRQAVQLTYFAGPRSWEGAGGSKEKFEISKRREHSSEW